MTTTQLDEALYRRYIMPTQRPRKRYVGVELEYPIVNARCVGLLIKNKKE